MRKSIATILFAGVFFAAILLGGTIGAFVDIPALAVVLGGTIFGVIAKHSFKELGDLKTNSDSIIGTAIIAAIISGVLGTLLGIVMILTNLSDPTAIGPALAVALLTTIYALIISGCLFLASKNLKINAMLVIAPLFLLMMNGAAVALALGSVGWV